MVSVTDSSEPARSQLRASAPAWARVAALAVVLGMGALSLRSLRPPEPLGAAAPDSVFAAARAWRHVETIAVEPHPVGSEAHDRVHDYVLQQLRSIGMDPVVASGPQRMPRTFDRTVGLRNIIAVLPGTAPTGSVALVCHYDSHPRAPGAGDDGLALAALLETARILRAGSPLRNDLVFVFTDAEELGLFGARAFVRDTQYDVRAVLNFEGRGSHGAVLMFETGPGNAGLVRVFHRADPRPIASSLFPEAYRYLPNDTDFTVFLRAGIRGLNFAHIDRAETYHHASDTPANASPATLQHHGEHALAMARAFGMLDLNEFPGPESGDAIYFNFPMLGLVRYPATLAVPHAVVVLVLWTVGVVFVRRRGGGVAGVGVGCAVSLLALIVCTFAAWVAGRIAATEADAGSLTNKLVIDEGPYMLAIVAVAITVVLLPPVRFARRLGGAALALGMTLLPALVGAAAAVVAPGVTYLLLWPALFAIVAACVIARAPAITVRDVVLVTVVLAFSIALWAPHLSLFLTGLTLSMAPALGAITAFAAMALAPLAATFGSRAGG